MTLLSLLKEIESWTSGVDAPPTQVAVATVVKVWGSAPRPLGSKMLIARDGRMSGSVSGGCVEGAVFEEAQGVLARGESKLVSYGVDNETAWSVGLSCGGRIDIFIEPVPTPSFDELAEAVRARRSVARSVLLRGSGKDRERLHGVDGTAKGSLGDEALDRRADEAVESLWPSLGAGRWAAAPEDDGDALFVEVFAPPPRLVIVGAVHVAVHLVSMVKTVGFETFVVDPRTAFATAERFAHVDHLLHDWPDEALRKIQVDGNTFVALLSHDLKLDVPALAEALPHARYVGALGSRKTQQKRLDAAREAGIDAELLQRIHNPIGLDLGGRRAEEMAVSILAELVAVSHGRNAR